VRCGGERANLQSLFIGVVQPKDVPCNIKDWKEKAGGRGELSYDLEILR